MSDIDMVHDAPAAGPLLHGRAALLVLLLGCAAFAAFAADLLLHGPLTSLDPSISTWFHQHARPALTIAMRAVTGLHATAVVLALAAVAATVLVLRGERAWVALLAACVPGGLMLNVLVKNIFQRPRPVFDHPLVTLPTYSFPSGHTCAATVAWGFALLWLFAHRRDARARRLGSILALVMVAFTALSRVYLGAHYVTDVLAASAEGTAWLGLCCLLVAPLAWRGRGCSPGRRQ
jgi:membrane-associated phospholipid phosphatase